MKLKTNIIIIFGIFVCLFPSQVYAKRSSGDVVIGTSGFMLANLADEEGEEPHFYQFNLGYRLSAKDTLSIEFITWRYYAPLGISYGDSSSTKENNFPGHVRASGVSLAYQRFLWQGLYTAFHAAWMSQEYYDNSNVKTSNGEQLFLTLRFGYYFDFFKGLFFIEPSIAFTHWPINTNLPDTFQIEEDRWSDYFLFEPGLHLGFNF